MGKKTELEYVGQTAFLCLTHSEGAPCQKEEIQEAEYELHNPITVKKNLPKQQHVCVCVKTSLYEPLDMHTVFCSAGTFSHYGEK